MSIAPLIALKAMPIIPRYHDEQVDMKGKLGAAFGSFGWSGEAVRMIEDRLRGLKLRVPLQGLRVKLVPTPEEIQKCRQFGLALGEELTGRRELRVIDMSDLFTPN